MLVFICIHGYTLISRNHTQEVKTVQAYSTNNTYKKVHISPIGRSFITVRDRKYDDDSNNNNNNNRTMLSLLYRRLTLDYRHTAVSYCESPHVL